MIRRVLVQSDAHKAPQRQRVRQPPGNPALRPDALEIPDQQRPKVNHRRQRRTPVLGRIELRTPLLDKLVEALGLQQLIQTLIKRMPWSRRQLGVRDPDLLLLLPLLARPHRHAPILQTNSVDTVKVLAYEPGLAPRAASAVAVNPNTNKIYVANVGSNNVTVIFDPADFTIVPNPSSATITAGQSAT